MKTRSKLPYIYICIITIITYIPILLTVVYSFNESKITSVWGGISLKWYQELRKDSDIKDALINSLTLAFLCCISAVIIGTLGALGMQKIKSKANDIMTYTSLIPIMIPEIILGMVFLAVFSFMQLPFGMVTLVIAHTSFCIPYIYMMVRARLAGMDKSIEEAAKDLGASPYQVFRDVTLPSIMPAIISGTLLSFAMSFDDVVISIFVTGPTINTLPIKIYTKLKTGVTPEINALATIMLAVTIFIILMSNRISKRQN